MQIQSLILLLLFKSCMSETSDLKTYLKEEINAFIDSATKLNLSSTCLSSLRKIHNFLFAYDTIREQRNFFYTSFATSTSAKLMLSKDRSRWHYHMLKCLRVPGETLVIASEYPLMYCNAYTDLRDNSSVSGLCLPTTCFSDKLQLADQWASYMESTNKSTYEIVQCTKSRHRKQWYERPEVTFGFTFIRLLFLIVAIATVYQAMRGVKSKSLVTDLLLAFSAIRNFKTMACPLKERKDLITCIFGLRVLATIWVIIAHSSIFIQDFLENVDEYRNVLRDNFFYQIVTNCFLSVDTFFLLSGTLTSYIWFQRKRRIDEPADFCYWLQFYWHRVLRLWPTYAYVLSCIVVVFSVMNHHPSWQLDDQREKCANNWWKNLLFINSINDNDCMPWAWYIGTDFIFYLLSPIYLLSFKKSWKLGVIISLATIIASATLNVITMIEFNFPPTQMLWVMPSIFNPDFMEHHRVVYIKPQYRIGPYIVGIMFGYYMATNVKKLSRKKLCIGWLLCGTLGFTSLFGLYTALQGWNWWLYYLSYAALHRIAWAMAIAWIIFVCHNGHADYLNRFLSLTPFVFLAAQSYSTYLYHVFAVLGVFLKAQFPMVFNGMQTLFGYSVVQVLCSYGLGVATAFIVEYPCVNIEKTIKERRKLRDTQNTVHKRQSEILDGNALLDDNLPVHK